MAKGDSGVGASGQPQAPKIDQYSVMHRLMDMGGNAMAPSAMPQQMGGRMNSMPMPRDVPQPVNGEFGQTPNSMVPEGIPDMIRRRMTGVNTYGSQ